MRPRRRSVSEEAPTTATARGHNSFPISGTRAPNMISAQAKAAGDDAAQDLRGAALNGKLGRDHGGEGELLLQAGGVGRLRQQKGGELAHPPRQPLLP